MKRRSVAGRLSRSLAASIHGAAVTAGSGAVLLAAVTWSQEPAFFVEDAEELTAEVTAVDPDTRRVSLQTDDGRELTVEAGEEVRNFAEIDVGDRVDVLFYEALAGEVTEAPAGDEDEPVVLESRRAPLGEKPKGAVGLVYTAVVTIDAVDPETDTVRFTGPGGQPREVTVERPELQEFIEQLKAGDRIQLTYGEALAVEVTPVSE